MKYFLFLIGVICVFFGVLGVFLIGPTPEKSIFSFSLNFNQSSSLFIIGNLSLGLYYLFKGGEWVKWWVSFLLLLIAVTILWFGGFFQNGHF